MPAIVTASQLRTVLGVSVSLYSDSYLDEIINTSEAVILPMLVANTSAVSAYGLKNNVATYYTQRPHYFVPGQSIVVTGLPAPFTATVTVVDTADYYFTAAITSADVTERDIIPRRCNIVRLFSCGNLRQQPSNRISRFGGKRRGLSKSRRGRWRNPGC
jgi:hypothetical protein